jgi:hypothetical protein
MKMPFPFPYKRSSVSRMKFPAHRTRRPADRILRLAQRGVDHFLQQHLFASVQDRQNPVQIGVALQYYAQSPVPGQQWGMRINFTPMFPD